MSNIFEKVTIDEKLYRFLEEAVITREFDKNEIISYPGTVEKYLSVIVSGHTGQFYYTSLGKELCYDLQFEGDYVCSLSSFITREEGLFEIRALEETKLKSIDYDKIMAKYHSMAKECDRTMKEITEILYIKTKRRLINFYNMSAEERYLELTKKAPDVINRTPGKYIASYLGITPETLSRIVSRLKNY